MIQNACAARARPPRKKTILPQHSAVDGVPTPVLVSAEVVRSSRQPAGNRAATASRRGSPFHGRGHSSAARSANATRGARPRNSHSPTVSTLRLLHCQQRPPSVAWSVVWTGAAARSVTAGAVLAADADEVGRTVTTAALRLDHRGRDDLFEVAP